MAGSTVLSGIVHTSIGQTIRLSLELAANPRYILCKWCGESAAAFTSIDDPDGPAFAGIPSESRSAWRRCGTGKDG